MNIDKEGNLQLSVGSDGALSRILANAYFQAGLSIVPGIGGPSQLILSAHLQEVKEKRWKEYWASIEDKVKRIDSEKLDLNYISSQDFLDRVASVHAIVTGNADSIKIAYLKRYIINCLWKNGPDITWKEIFLQYLRNLTGSHLRILQEFYNIQESLSEKERFGLNQRNERAPLTIHNMKVQCKDLFSDETLVILLINDLNAMGLLRQWPGDLNVPEWWSITKSGILLLNFVSNE